MYRITTDLAKAIIEIKLEGFWSLDQVDQLSRDLAAQAARVALTGRRQAVLYDYTDVTIQSQDVIGVLQGMARNDDFKSRRVALYSAGRMAVQQARRVAAASDRFAVFDNRGAALDWLAAA